MNQGFRLYIYIVFNYIVRKEIIHMNNSFLDSISLRRSTYGLGATLPVDKSVVTKTIKEAVRLAPSAFNSQSARVVVLYGNESKKLWDMIFAALVKIIPSEQVADTKARIEGFARGAGTAMVFEETSVIASLQKGFPLYADNFPLWSAHATGITQFSIWSALANIKVGASLQHYGNLVEDEVRKAWNIPLSWSLIAQMPFGSIENPAGEKQYQDIEDRVKVFA